jgi:two-component system response regulator YesN
MFCALLVDDDELARSRLGWVLLKRYPWIRVEEATGVADAMQAIDSLRPDVVLSSLNLVGGSGVRLVEQMKALHPGVKVVAMSRYDLPEYRQAARSSGADAFVSKESAAYLDDLVAQVGRNLAKCHVQAVRG